ncbi:alpha/beta fold hydrolase [candidate division KSB1 bacterium]|nr:alpha/beta fold hydrolase [candidate division KSB1 bacterium]
MNQKLTFIMICCWWRLLVSNVAAQTPPDSFIYSEKNVLDFYEYDRSQPLNARFDTTGTILQYYKIDVWFTSIHGEVVPGKIWSLRDGSAAKKAPCIIWLHGYGGNKQIDDLAFAILGPNLGCAFLALDAQYHGSRRESSKVMFSLDLIQDRYAFVQTIIDYRRALDLLEMLPAIDTDNIGLLGGSMGGILGALLASVDSRIKATVLIVGGGHWSEMMRISDHPTAPALRQYLKGNFQAIDRLLEPVDPWRVIQRIHNLQMHNGTADLTVPYSNAVELYERAGEPKEFYSYPGLTHESLFQDEYAVVDLFTRTIEWYRKHLNLPAPPR